LWRNQLRLRDPHDSTVLLGMLMPALQRAHDRALKVSCANNLRQLYSAVESYSYASHDYIPLGYDCYEGSNYVAYDGRVAGQPKQMLGLLDNLNLLDVPSIAYCNYDDYDATSIVGYSNYIFLNLSVTPSTGIWEAFDQQ
jgi:hypothetical protein